MQKKLCRAMGSTRQNRSGRKGSSGMDGRRAAARTCVETTRRGSESRVGPGAGPQRGARRGGINIADRLSEQANKLLQQAGQKAHEFGRTEVDTE
ncbi:MAG: hypothetical protein E2577_15275, partial [Starkeya sp.]|nr:hypothetical protein [Starkeya sp.]